MSSLVPYHFFVIWMLSLLSMAVHNATLLALVRDYRRDWVLRWLRQLLMLLNLALSCVYGVFVLRAVSLDLPQTLPIGCVWRPGAGKDTSAASNVGISYVGTIAVIAGNGVIFALATWYLHTRARRYRKAVQVAGLVLMLAIAIGAAVRVVLLSQAFGQPSVALTDLGETQWSFGQLLGLLFLLLPLLSVIEIMRGEMHVDPLPPNDDESGIPLANSGEAPFKRAQAEFEPNPFFGSQNSLFKK